MGSSASAPVKEVPKEAEEEAVASRSFDLGVFHSNINAVGRKDVVANDAATMKMIHHRVAGAPETSDRFALPECSTGRPHVEDLVRGLGIPFLGPAFCGPQNPAALRFERAMNQESIMRRDDMEVSPRTVSLTGAPSRVAVGEERAAPIRIVTRAMGSAAAKDAILSSRDHAPAYVDIAARYARAQGGSQLSAHQLRNRYGPMATMDLGNLSASEVDQLREARRA